MTEKNWTGQDRHTLEFEIPSTTLEWFGIEDKRFEDKSW